MEFNYKYGIAFGSIALMVLLAVLILFSFLSTKENVTPFLIVIGTFLVGFIIGIFKREDS